MRRAALKLLSLVLLLPACAPASDPPEEPTPGVAPVPIVAGKLTIRSPQAAVVENRVESHVFEMGIGATGTLELSLWDRKGRREGPASRVLLGPTGRGVAEGDRLTLRFEWRVRDGEWILDEFVRPIGGKDAVSALVTAIPDFASRRLATVELTTSDGTTGRVSTRLTGDQAPPSSGFRSSSLPLGDAVAEVPAGEEAILFASLWLGPAQIAGPDAHPTGAVAIGGAGFRSDGSVADASLHAGPFWTLRAKLVPGEH